MRERGSESFRFEPPEEENARLRDENIRLHQIGLDSYDRFFPNRRKVLFKRYVYAAFSVAAHLETDTLLLNEVLAARQGTAILHPSASTLNAAES